MRLVAWINESLGTAGLAGIQPMLQFLGLQRKSPTQLFPVGAMIPVPTVVAESDMRMQHIRPFSSARALDRGMGAQAGADAGATGVSNREQAPMTDDTLAVQSIVASPGTATAALQAGDILLFKTRSFAASLQRQATGSLWDHVALVVPAPEKPSDRHTQRVERAQPEVEAEAELFMTEVTGEGVGTYPLQYRLSLYARSGLAEHVAVRRLRFVSSPSGRLQSLHHDVQARLRRYVDRVTGRPYALTLSRLLIGRIGGMDRGPSAPRVKRRPSGCFRPDSSEHSKYTRSIGRHMM